MSELPELVIDKSAWGDGPWQTEPDRVDFVANGFACLLLRHPNHGHWCGYVGVPREHPAYERTENYDLDFHGTVNYAAHCSPPICHVPEPGMPDDVWWLGGDFGRIWDLCPGVASSIGRAHEFIRMVDPIGAAAIEEFEQRVADRKLQRPVFLRGVYRDVAYVRAETERLAEQLAAMVVA